MSARTKLDLFTPRPKSIRYILGYVALFLGSMVAKISVSGRDNIPKEGPFIFVANHFNVSEPPFFVYALRKPINFLVASDQVIEWYNYWAVWLYGFIPTNRTRLGPSTIKMAKKVFDQKEVLGIFPEGDTQSDTLRSAKPGVVYLSTLGQVPIIPMSIYGIKKGLWEYIFTGIRPKISIRIGKPCGPYSIPKDRSKREIALSDIGDEIMCRIAALLPEDSHGQFKNNPLIKKFQEQNEPSSEIQRNSE